MKIGKAFGYMFEDPKWVSKILLGALVAIVPILNFAWVGYCLGIIRNLAEGKDPLPSWDDLGEKFVDGFKLMVASFLYTLPASIIFFIIALISVVPVLMAGGSTDEVMSVAMGTAGLLNVLLCGVAGLYFMIYSILFPAISIHFARNGTLASCFQLSAIFTLVKKNFSAYITAWLMGMVAVIAASFAAGLVGGVVGLIPCLGQVIAVAVGAAGGAWGSLVMYHLYGQVGIEISD